MEQLNLSVDTFGRLVLTDADGERHVGVEPVRAFPLSHPDRFVALVDERGREVFTVDDPSTLPPAVRSVLEAELREAGVRAGPAPGSLDLGRVSARRVGGGDRPGSDPIHHRR